MKIMLFKSWRHLGTSALLVLSSVVVMEISLRIWSQFPGNSKRFVSDASVGFRPRPGMEARGLFTNARGFNDVDHPAGGEDGPERIVFVGDSFVFGVGPRSQNLVSFFGTLAEREGRQFEVFNMGVPAAGPENYLGLLKNDAREARADIVWVVFFVGNDVFQAHPDFLTRVWLGTPRAVLRSPWLLRPSGDYVYVYKLLRGVSRLTRNRIRKARNEAFSENLFLEIESRSMGICRREADSSLAAAFGEAANLLRRMKEESDRNGMQLFVALAPDRFQVEPELRSQLVAKFGWDSDQLDFEQPQRILRRSLELAQIPVHDLLPIFREHSSEELYFPRDTHWNARGNELAAQSIFRYLESQKRGTEQ